MRLNHVEEERRDVDKLSGIQAALKKEVWETCIDKFVLFLRSAC